MELWHPPVLPLHCALGKPAQGTEAGPWCCAGGQRLCSPGLFVVPDAESIFQRHYFCSWLQSLYVCLADGSFGALVFRGGWGFWGVLGV